MTNIRDILAYNLKENRKKCRLSQAKLAEKAKITTQYVAMIEVSRKFPTPEMLERLAKALEIETYELFTVSTSPKNELELLRQDILGEIEQIVVRTIKDTLNDEVKGRKK